jgi:hypothetical protein
MRWTVGDIMIATVRFTQHERSGSRRMGAREQRKFTLLDSAGLMAATAVGLAWGRGAWPALMSTWFVRPKGGWTFLEVFGVLPNALLTPFPMLAAGTLTILGLRLVQPRPPLNRPALQPGTAACGAATIALMMAGLGLLAESLTFVVLRGNSWLDFVEEMPFWTFIFFRLASGTPPAACCAILSVWIVLALSRHGRLGNDWVDRAGCVIGVLWIITALCWWVQDLDIIRSAVGKLGYSIQSPGGAGMGGMMRGF